ncbi:DUF896 domain-containing protein [Paenibacillus sp. SC116]|uniref:DUF896 domain-containing protein n=1 Tax=Paenibacillus sp. SC116 TaxID=2968986 RepID=UPI00215AA1E6|nr:DUF896 domain-containing protein [Paenibacillus sp. SC116]MCR8845297.1 DUF896 domain-containing protein [Paenibacillus sp. SC116]
MINILDRINVLARKNKAGGLTPAELEERQLLRQQYLGIIRGHVDKSFHAITFLDAQGHDVTPKKLTQEQEQSSVQMIDAI